MPGTVPVASLLAGLLLAAPARAGDLLVRAEVPVEVTLATAPLLTTWGPTTVRVPGLTAGTVELQVQRGKKVDYVKVEMPTDGTVALDIGATALSTQPVETAEAPPVLELRAARGQRFALVLNGNRVAVLSSFHPVRVEGIAAGPHKIELRSPDLTVVWARADLDLKADDVIVLTAQEGFAPLVSGRTNAVMLTGPGSAGGG